MGQATPRCVAYRHSLKAKGWALWSDPAAVDRTQQHLNNMANQNDTLHKISKKDKFLAGEGR